MTVGGKLYIKKSGNGGKIYEDKEIKGNTKYLSQQHIFSGYIVMNKNYSNWKKKTYFSTDPEDCQLLHGEHGGHTGGRPVASGQGYREGRGGRSTTVHRFHKH